MKPRIKESYHFDDFHEKGKEIGQLYLTYATSWLIFNSISKNYWKTKSRGKYPLDNYHINMKTSCLEMSSC